MPSWNKTYNFVDFAISFHPPIRLTCETQARHNHKNQRGGIKKTKTLKNGNHAVGSINYRYCLWVVVKRETKTVN